MNRKNKEHLTYEEYIKKYQGSMIYDEKTDNFFDTVEDLESFYIDECRISDIAKPLPAIVYGVYRMNLDLRIEQVVEDALWDLYDNARHDLRGFDDFKEAVSKFEELNKDTLATYYKDENIVIELRKKDY